MSSSTVKWFDLSDHDAKLERHDTDGAGHYKLVMDLPASRLEPLTPDAPGRTLAMDLLDIGWQAEPLGADRYRLTNHGSLNRKSEIVAALRPFFSEQEVEASHVSVLSLRQGERVEGLQVRQLVTEAELRRTIEGVEPADLDRIASSVRKAQELQAERRARQTQVLFNGRGRQLYGYLTGAVTRRTGWEEAEAAFVAQSQMVAAAQAPHSVHAVRLTDLAKALDGGTEEEVALGENYALGRMAGSSAHWDSLLERARGDQAFVDAIERFKASAPGPLVGIRDVMLAQGGHLAPDVMDRMEVAIPEDQVFGYYKDRLPFMVIRDSSVPTRVLAQNMAAVDAALDVVAEELEVPRGALVPRQSTVPMRFSYDAVSGDGALGVLQSIDGGEPSGSAEGDEERAALTMNLSVTKGRSFLHELGHLVDRGNRLSPEERHAILSRSGVLADAKVAVDRRFPEGGAFADYLRKEEEVFARAFDAHFVNVVRARGDTDLRAVGGLQTTQGFDQAAPFGDLEKTSAFMAELKDVLAMRREARHEARQKADVEPVGSAVSFQMG